VTGEGGHLHRGTRSRDGMTSTEIHAADIEGLLTELETTAG